MKDNRAVAQLKCWFRAVGISFRPGNSADLAVTNAQGELVEISVVVKGSSPISGALAVEGADIMGRDLKFALETFAGIQTSLGFEPKSPVDRGQIPTHKLSNGESFELSAFRHTEMRRVPNPDPAKFALYAPVIDRTVKRFFSQRERLCLDNMLTVDDLRTYAQVWLTAFLGVCELAPEEQKREDENSRLLYNFLGQRFAAFEASLKCQGRNVFPMLDDAYIGMRGTPYDYSNRGCWDGDVVTQEDAESAIDLRRREWRRGQRFEVDSSADESERRDMAAEVLDRLLSERGHDEMLQILKAAVDNDRIAPDARSEAERRLRKHDIECRECTTEEPTRDVSKLDAELRSRNSVFAPPSPSNTSTESLAVIADDLGNTFSSPGEAARFWGGMTKQHVRAVLNGGISMFNGRKFHYIDGGEKVRPVGERNPKYRGAGIALGLSSRKRKEIVQMFYDGGNKTEVSRRAGLNRSTVSRILDEATE
jgi:hypothetical protein